jgi:hypothetical protein
LRALNVSTHTYENIYVCLFKNNNKMNVFENGLHFAFLLALPWMATPPARVQIGTLPGHSSGPG